MGPISGESQFGSLYQSPHNPKPTHLAWSDLCPFGIGGYTLSGRAWRIQIPKPFPFKGDDEANNVLEFLGMAISILLLIEESQSTKYACLMALGDNTFAISWI